MPDAAGNRHARGGPLQYSADAVRWRKAVLEILKSGGWLMAPIVLCSILALAICIERSWTLRYQRILPPNTLAEVWSWIRRNELGAERMRQLRNDSPLGRIMAAGLGNARHGRTEMKESVEEAAAHVVHELERYLNTLGTIAQITPLLGLLGTVVGMIEVFSDIMLHGTGNAELLAGGISQALITTAAGLSVAIPSLMMHRFFLRKVDTIVVGLEQQSLKLVDAIHGERGVEVRDGLPQ